ARICRRHYEPRLDGPRHGPDASRKAANPWAAPNEAPGCPAGRLSDLHRLDRADATITRSRSMIDAWTIKGELILNCNCTVFCPCVVSLGKHPPTEGYCQAWAGVRIDEGRADGEDLSGLNAALLL